MVWRGTEHKNDTEIDPIDVFLKQKRDFKLTDSFLFHSTRFHWIIPINILISTNFIFLLSTGFCLITSAFIMMLVSVYDVENNTSGLELVSEFKEVECAEEVEDKIRAKDYLSDNGEIETNSELKHVLRVPETILMWV